MKFFSLVFSLIFFTILFTLNCLGSGCGITSGFGENEENPLLDSEEIQKALLIQQAAREIYKEVSPSVVRIETEQNIVVESHPFFKDFFGIPGMPSPSQKKKQGLGSGFFINESGLVVTNYHVVDKVDRIKVKLLNGSDYDAEIIGFHKPSDLALLKIESDKPVRPVRIGNSKKNLVVGDLVYAIGNPFGLSATLTSGVVSSIGQEIETPDGVPRIQTDTAINPGNSGGPLLNLQAEVIGINQMIYSNKGGSIGISFAIPINYAMTIIQKLKSGRKITSPYIGINFFKKIPNHEAESLGLTNEKGLMVQSVVLGSPAAKSGIQKYDFITHADNKPLEKIFDLQAIVARKKPGQKVRLKIIRRQKKINVSLIVRDKSLNN